MLTALSSPPSLPEPPPGNRDWQGVTTTCGTCGRAQALSLLLRRPADPAGPADPSAGQGATSSPTRVSEDLIPVSSAVPSRHGWEGTDDALGKRHLFLMKNKNTRVASPGPGMLEGGWAPRCRGVFSATALVSVPSLQTPPLRPAVPCRALALPWQLGSSTQGWANPEGTIPEGPA